MLLVFASCILTGCTIPCGIYFRNLTGSVVRLQATLLDRCYFDKLPNAVNFYDTAQKSKTIIGNWKYQRLVTWVDSTGFFIDVPPKTSIDVADISNGLTLGTHSPMILLLAVRENKIDTVTTGYYTSVADKFKVKGGAFSKPVYYYDLK